MKNKLLSLIKNFFTLINQSVYKTSLKPIKKSKNEYQEISNFFEEKAILFSNFVKPVEYNESKFKLFDNSIMPKLKRVSRIGDDLGIVYSFRSCLYRLIKMENKNDFIELYSSGILDALSSIGFLPKFDYFKVDDKEYCFALKCVKSKLKPIEEMTFNECRDSLLFVSFLELVLNKKGFSLSDPHYYNYALFDKKPFYFDIGSIKRGKNNQYSMVVLGFYHLVSFYFENSIFHNYILGSETIWSSTNRTGRFFDRSVEMTNIKRTFLNFHKVHSSKIVSEIARKCLNEFIVRPGDIYTLFYYNSFDEITFLNSKVIKKKIYGTFEKQ